MRPANAFYLRKGKPGGYCKPCSKAQSAATYRATDPEKLRRQKREWSASASAGGAGGAGVASSITGASVVYGAGAGGCALNGGAAATGGVAGVGFNVAPNAGTDGLGNGGSGASGTGAGATSGAGGKGVFIVGYWLEAA